MIGYSNKSTTILMSTGNCNTNLGLEMSGELRRDSELLYPKYQLLIFDVVEI